MWRASRAAQPQELIPVSAVVCNHDTAGYTSGIRPARDWCQDWIPARSVRLPGARSPLPVVLPAARVAYSHRALQHEPQHLLELWRGPTTFSSWRRDGHGSCPPHRVRSSPLVEIERVDVGRDMTGPPGSTASSPRTGIASPAAPPPVPSRTRRRTEAVPRTERAQSPLTALIERASPGMPRIGGSVSGVVHGFAYRFPQWVAQRVWREQ